MESSTNNILPAFGAKSIVCYKCLVPFSEEQDLLQHFCTHVDEKPFACCTCPKRFRRKRNLTNHIRVHTGEQPFVCKTCGKKFSIRANLYTHSRLHSGEKRFVCNFCDKKFSQKCSLTIHLRLHTGERPYACSLCPKTFYDPSHLSKHVVKCQQIKNHSEEPSLGARQPHDEKPKKICNICNKIFFGTKSLDNHIRIHHVGKPCYICHKCNKKYFSEKSLNRHIQTHNIQFVCKFCDKQFSKKYFLTIHLRRLHKDEMPYTCSICPRRFRTKDILTKHYSRRHTSEKPHIDTDPGENSSTKNEETEVEFQETDPENLTDMHSDESISVVLETIPSATESQTSQKQQSQPSSVLKMIAYFENKKRTDLDGTDLLFLRLAKKVKEFSRQRQAFTKLRIAEIIMQQEILHHDKMDSNILT